MIILYVIFYYIRYIYIYIYTHYIYIYIFIDITIDVSSLLLVGSIPICHSWTIGVRDPVADGTFIPTMFTLLVFLTS